MVVRWWCGYGVDGGADVGADVGANVGVDGGVDGDTPLSGKLFLEGN